MTPCKGVIVSRGEFTLAGSKRGVAKMITYPPIPFFIVKAKVHSIPLTLDPKNLKQILLIKPTY